MITAELVNEIRQCLQAILSESDNVKHLARSGVVDQEIFESTASIEKAAMRIEASMVAEFKSR